MDLCPRHLLRDLELFHHPHFIVHLDPALHQIQFCAVKIRKPKLIDFKLLDQRRKLFFLSRKMENSQFVVLARYEFLGQMFLSLWV